MFVMTQVSASTETAHSEIVLLRAEMAGIRQDAANQYALLKQDYSSKIYTLEEQHQVCVRVWVLVWMYLCTCFEGRVLEKHSDYWLCGCVGGYSL